jgi:hypothetical protein
MLLWIQARVLTDTFGEASQKASFRFFSKALSCRWSSTRSARRARSPDAWT